jgi:hypothetical protein
MEATVAATFSQQRPRFHKLERTRPWVAANNHDVRVPGVYLTSAFLAFLYFLSERRMNDLRVCNGLDGSIPTRASTQYGVRVIRVDIPRPLNEYNQFIDVIPESARSRHGVKPVNGTPTNGKPPGDKNGHD